MSFYEQWQQIDWQSWQQSIAAADTNSVEQVLQRTDQQRLQINDLAVLLSPAAKPTLEAMAQRAAHLTRQRFGHTMRLFVPLYLSNLCANDCSYCGFSMSNALRRKTLTMDELRLECTALQAQGFDSILLVAGEHERQVGMAYFKLAVPVVREYFSHVALEVQPLQTAEYVQLRELGLAAVSVYQETYDADTYAKHHLRGKKTNFRWRLETPDRVATAGIDKIGLGALLGLADWRSDALACALHLRYLQKHYWRSRYSIAFPRLRPYVGDTADKGTHSHIVSDSEMVQLICAFRLFEPDLEINLSTRESATLRDYLLPLGVTHMSAGSKTQPGGYADQIIALEQFQTNDQRSPQAVATALQQHGFEPVWKDWEWQFG